MNSKLWFKRYKLIRGFLIAPIVAPISFLIFIRSLILGCPILGIKINPASAVVFPRAAIVFGIPASYICAIVIGLPYVLFMRKRGLLNFKTIMIPTIAFAILFAVLSRYIWTGVTNEIWFGWSVYVFIGTGPWIILSGVCFYLLSVKTHPNHPLRQLSSALPPPAAAPTNRLSGPV